MESTFTFRSENGLTCSITMLLDEGLVELTCSECTHKFSIAFVEHNFQVPELPMVLAGEAIIAHVRSHIPADMKLRMVAV